MLNVDCFNLNVELSKLQYSGLIIQYWSFDF
jgi:hypothetical protein